MDKLFDRTITITPADSKTNIRIPVEVPRDYAALLICTRYEPKVVADQDSAREAVEAAIEKFIPEPARPVWGNWRDYMPVVNFITLSLDCGEEYIGCAHRHSPEQDHIISAGYASPGFIRHAASAGLWRCVLNCHAVVDETVRYSLKVYGADEGEDIHDRIQAF